MGKNALKVLVVLVFTGWCLGQSLSITDVGYYSRPTGGPDGLSGLTYAGGNQWYAVDDSYGSLYPMTIVLDPATGAISSSTIGSAVSLAGSTDLEGVAYNPAHNSVYVSDETGPGIREYNLSGGNPMATVNVPAVYNNIRSNLSLESLSRQSGTGSLWTANEDALSVDGDIPTTSKGTLVRLQKFDANLNPAGQWAYLSEPISSSFPSSSSEQNGISDIAVLPNGKVLVLERMVDAYMRSLWAGPRYLNRIFEVDFTGATDISGFSSLASGGFTTLTKRKLWEGEFSDYNSRLTNFEGLGLGPRLANGDYSLLLISDGDDSGGYTHLESYYALRLSGEVPEPTTLTLLFAMLALAINRRIR